MIFQKVAQYMNSKHKANYIVYNLFSDRQLDQTGNSLHQVTEYPFPKATMVAGLDDSDNMLKFTTAPPTLRQLFLVVLEMASWINLSDDEKNIVLLLRCRM